VVNAHRRRKLRPSPQSGKGQLSDICGWLDQGADLNGDSDLYDRVLHLVNAENGRQTNTGLDVYGTLDVAGGRVACGVVESGFDLNGDGDTNDVVAHVVEFGGTVRNLGWAAYQWALDEEFVAVPVEEIYQGGSDLNGDGDAWDSVLFVCEFATGKSAGTGLSILASPGSLLTQDGRVIFLADETASGGQDLNQDGDALDRVLHVHQQGATANLGLAAVAGLQVEGSRVLLSVAESAQGGVDRNGDGDVLDSVLAVADLGGGPPVNLGLATPTSGPYVQFVGDWVACDVLEQDQGSKDLNGDGDAGDLVEFLYLSGTGQLINLNLATWSQRALESGGLFAFGVREDSQGARDLNGDGDSLDQVLHMVR